MPRLILHAGSQKTGTTSIQSVLSTHRSALREQGLFYPCGSGIFGKSKTPHHQFAHGLTNTRTDRIAASASFAAKASSEAKDSEVILISAEPIYRHILGQDHYVYPSGPSYWKRRKGYLDAVAAAFPSHEIEVVLFLRNKDDFVRAFVWDLNSKTYWSGDEADFRRDMACLLDYDRQIETFRACFPKLTLVDYDEALRNGGSIPAFFDQIGVKMPDGADSVRLRQSSPVNSPTNA